MAKPKIPHGFHRDPRTGRLKKNKPTTRRRRRQTGRGRRTQKGGGIAAAALPLAKMLAPIIVPLAVKEGKKLIKRQMGRRGGGLRLMGQKD